MDQERNRALRSDYYVVNFHTLMSFVCKTYDDLLEVDEKRWYEKLCECTESAQRLYIRLLSRRGSIFRQSRLCYTEIVDLAGAASELDQQGLATISPPQNLVELAACFTKAELIHHLQLKPCNFHSRVELLASLELGELTLIDQHRATLQAADKWISLHGHRYFTLMQLCFFGNLHQDISEFVLRDLGTVRYANYPISSSDRPFQTRAQIDAHLTYYECRALSEIVDRRDPGALMELAKKLPVTPDNDFHLMRRVDRLRNTIARQLERLTQHNLAMALYAQSATPPARERRVRWLLSQKRLDDAFNLCSEMLDEPSNEAERHKAGHLLKQWRKASDLPVIKRERFRPRTSRLVLTYSQARVERAACDFYQRYGHCHYVENSLFSGVLGLVIWDIIFHPMPGAFFNPFQSAPADFRQPSFARSRQTLLEKRLREIENPESFKARVLTRFDSDHGIANPLVRWERLQVSLLERAIEQIPVSHWLAVFNRVLADPGEHSTGFPDLIFFPEEGGYELIEIKGPGDALQSNQLRWLQYFDEHRIPCRVVKVLWSNTLTVSRIQ